MVLTIIVCAIIADFITGFVHWFEDSYITLETPILGNLIGRHNVEHHEYPTWIGTMSTLISRNLQTVTAAVVATLVYVFFFNVFWPVILILVFTAFGNEIHTWSHQPAKKKNWLIKLLQEMCIVQTPRHHVAHHKKPYETRYCTLLNILNPVLDAFKFWRMLEWLILKTTGIKHVRSSNLRKGY